MSGNKVSAFISNPFSRITRTFVDLFILFVFFIAFSFILNDCFLSTTFAQESNKSEQKKDENERKILAEINIAKRLIENKEWEKARLKLKNIVTDFPQNSHSDIAYFWLAYTFFQQKNFSEAEQTISVLQRNFPTSTWVNESKSLLAEINSLNKRQINVTDEVFAKSDDEGKAFAVQNLLETDRPKAIIKIDEILDSTDPATNSLKESILILMFDDKSDWAADKFIKVIKTETNGNLLKQALIGLKKRDEQKITPVLHDFLAKNTNVSLLDAALYTVSKFPEESAIRMLIDFAKNGSNEKLKQKSIIWLGNIGSKKAIEELKTLYANLSDTKLKQQIQISLAEINKPEPLNVLINLIEGETDKFLIKHGLEMLKRKIEPSVFKNLTRKLQIEN